MGYDLYITRRENLWDEEGEDIGAAEWEAAVAADSGIVAVPLPEGCPERVAELVPLRNGESSGEPLWWRAGQIKAKNPTDAMVSTMCRLAKALNARVQGEDGEHYDM
ncbi:hypothetical protein [Streptomyces sp. TLI_053]|uniref:hypothetical protein n=1 Tax=Streptomyces sp. TLI_053 TaxID=1855352 RepID=UPI000B866543|nr:hypothetical protein [Streptomyces sp. TLI_053]